jgi:hypothetical protein
MQRKSHHRNYTKSLYMSGLWVSGSSSTLYRRQLPGEPERRWARARRCQRRRRLLFRCLLFQAGAGTGINDSSRVRLEAGSPWPPWARSAISFLAATLLAFEMRWIPSPAQMLAPSTAVRYWGEDSQEPKKPRMLINLAFPVRSPAAAASEKLFQLHRIWRQILRSAVRHMVSVFAAGGQDIPW